MTREEYKEIKDYTYNQFITYLNNKYGECIYLYTDPKSNRNTEGLFRHHIRENEEVNLSHRLLDKAEYQKVVWCDYFEHLFLHILIGEETEVTKGLGINGALIISSGIKECIEEDTKQYREEYYKYIDKEVYDILMQRLEKVIRNRRILLEHNETLYAQVKYNLDTYNRALLILGTGLGKTTCALQYIIDNNIDRALIVVPNNTIRDGWEKYEQCEVITYQALVNKAKQINFNKYGLVALDEVHHIGNDEEKGIGAKEWSKGVSYLFNIPGLKILGLTATPERTDGIDISNLFTDNTICQGLTIEEGIQNNIIYPFSYITSIYDFTEIQEAASKSTNKELLGKLDIALNNIPPVYESLKKYTANQEKVKGIIFIQDKEDVSEAINLSKKAFPNHEYRLIHSTQNKGINEENREWFKNTEEGFLISVNMISEGAHYNGVNTIIMFRSTQSYLLFMQQIGRIITLKKDKDPKAVVFDFVNNIYNVSKNSAEQIQNMNKLLNTLKDAADKEEYMSNQIIVKTECQEAVDVFMRIKEDMSDSWAEWEINIIKEHYPKNGLKKTFTILKEEYINRGIDCKRTIDAVRHKASTLNIKSSKFWSEEAMSILQEWYPVNIDKCFELLKQERESITRKQMIDMATSKGISRRKRKIYCAELDTEFSSTKEIFTKLNITKNAISECCNGHYNTVGGYHFAYSDNTEKVKELSQFIGLERGKTTTQKRTEIICIETGIIYKNAIEVSKVIKATSSQISKCCRGHLKTAKGYHLCYADDTERINELSKYRIINTEA